MSEIAMGGTASAKTPWHVWVVGGLSLLWNVSGAWTIMAAQSGAVMDMTLHRDPGPVSPMQPTRKRNITRW